MRYAHLIGIGDGSAAGPIWRTYFQIDDLLSHPFGWRETFVDTLRGQPEPPRTIVRYSRALSMPASERAKPDLPASLTNDQSGCKPSP